MIETACKTRFWSTYKEMCQHHRQAYAGGAVRLQKKVFRLLKSAGEVSHWQCIAGNAGVDLDTLDHDSALEALRHFPVSQKHTYMSGFPDQVTVSGDKATWQFLSSAGTNDRMTVVTDFDKRDYLRAAEHLNIRLSQGHPFGKCTIDIPPSACNVVCGLADDGPEPLWRYVIWSAK